MNPLLVAIPGNHDLVRPDKKNAFVKLLQSHWYTDPDIQESFWKSPESEYRQVVNNAFTNFVIWWKELDLPKIDFNTGLIPGEFSSVFEKDGLRLGIIGLNTAFLHLTDDDYEGKLDVNERQIHSVCEGDAEAWYGTALTPGFF